MRQKDLAHRAGVAPRAFSSAEHEGLVSVATAEKIADALGIPLTAIWPRETP
jgi:DNA-binding XRE family transcriptional regulator